jgi:hypothetical protein
VRAALDYPGRDALLAERPPLVFRTTDGGETWTRATEVPFAVRADVERQWASFPLESGQLSTAPRLPQAQRQQKGQAQQKQAAPAPPPPEHVTHVADEVILTFLDPLRLLSLEARAQLVSISGAFWVALPTREGWTALVDSLAAASQAEGEITLGRAVRVDAELLRSSDGGVTFSAVPGLPDLPLSLAPTEGAVYLSHRGGPPLRLVP